MVLTSLRTTVPSSFRNMSTRASPLHPRARYSVFAVSRTSERASAEMSAGTTNVEFSEPLSGSLLLMDPEEAVRESNPVDLAGDQLRAVPEDGAAHLAADHGLFDQHLRVVPPCGLHRARQFFSPDTLLTPKDEPERAGLTNTG